MDSIYLMQKEMLRRGYSQRTIITYTQCIRQFMRYNREDIRKATKLDIKNYIDKHVEKKNSGSTLNVNINAIKFLMEEILNKKITLKIRYSKTPKTMPIFLTKDEVKQLFNAINNEKHKLILELIYSAGLRVSEVINLKNCDFEFERMIGWVRNGKGNKDRPFIIAKCLKEKLENYIRNNCEFTNSFLFSGRNSTKLSVRSIQEIVKKAANKAGIKKNVHPHTLRHSYATHLIENGYDVATVQPLMGHNSAETTLGYVHMANPKLIKVISPYDEF